MDWQKEPDRWCKHGKELVTCYHGLLKDGRAVRVLEVVFLKRWMAAGATKIL